MTSFRRLEAVSVVVATAAFLTFAQVWGDTTPAKPRGKANLLPAQGRPAPNADRSGTDEVAPSKFSRHSMDLTSQTVVAADGSYIKLSITPVFQTVDRVQPEVRNPLIPGDR